MSPGVNRIIRFFLWLLLTVLVVLASAVTALRVGLPQLNKVQPEIVTWINQGTGLNVSLKDVRGFWRNTHPSISLQGVSVSLSASSETRFEVDNLELEFDLIQTIIQRQPVLADMVVNDMMLDIRSVDLLKATSEQAPTTDKPAESGEQLISRLDNLLLRQLDRFSVANSTILYQAISGEMRQLDIDKLQWRNEDVRHLAQGTVSIADANLNALEVRADFIDNGSLSSVSGDFYLTVDEMSLSPWLSEQQKQQTGIQGGSVSLRTWITLKDSNAKEAYLEVLPSELNWSKQGQNNDLFVESAVLHLLPTENGWQLNVHEVNARTNDVPWPELDIALDWNRQQQWQLNISQLDIDALKPLATLSPDEQVQQWLDKLNPGGRIEDIRMAQMQGEGSLKYSAKFAQLSMSQWALLPGFSQVSGMVKGDLKQAHARVTVIDDRFPYGDVFQAPLNIKQGLVDVYWQDHGESGWSLWSDKVTAATPDLQVLGAFRLDFPVNDSPFLSFYAEADLYNAGETWRYLPTRAMGQRLTDYLSAAIQGGRVNTAKLLWYGKLSDFPYREHNGMFQAWVGLRDAKFSFDTNWPPLTDLQLDLLFQNETMHLDSRSATLMDVKGQRITGRIPVLNGGGHLEIEAKASGDGSAVRDYMTASPLVDSVGAALTAVQVGGEVEADFQLYIPFSGDETPSRAWGYAQLKDNHVEIDAPPMTLEKVSGRVEFDNDVVRATGLSADLLTQPISLDFQGQNAGKGYAVAIDAVGDWATAPLKPYVGEKFIGRVKGHAPWNLDVDIQLNDVGFTYQLDLNANLATITSEYPYPLKKAFGESGKARLQASGNQEAITARLQLPSVKYQTEIDITGDVPVLEATNLVLGKGGFKISPIVGHHFQVRSDKFDFDQWSELFKEPPSGEKAVLDDLNKPELPLPKRASVEAKELMLGGIEWHDVNFDARYKKGGWQFELDSQEAKGQASYSDNNELHVALKRLHIYVPEFDQKAEQDESLITQENPEAPLVTDFDRSFFTALPDTQLTVDNFWFQGYKVGKVNMEVEREGSKLVWRKLDLTSGTNQVHIDGDWQVAGQQNETRVNLKVKGENNSDLMERFGISSGIQRAPFELNSSMSWDGAPWSMRLDTVNGEINTKLGKGVISDVSGAARLLGLFSLDSIIRKMQLDFTDVFDKGMAFNSITGSGKVRDGIFVTNDIKMDAVAGEMIIKGLADLSQQTVDAQVKFTPDMTSGIPIITAFAVTPQTALVVLAVTTVISPVVEVVTQVNYEVKGPLDSPTVKEISRTKGEYKLPENLKKESK
ncbi:YhdP family protein [Vibrio hangzhouensis]|uniref:YhdP family protein n=1 Tax=Vibrio hangzhouensis TaxID=462991 RepID=UPI001C985462|nr:YhdP family protein [Vibrio hangzhouensis]MBY6197085.1 TIGR02099 family protein [Vibrio hangzhouensis]